MILDFGPVRLATSFARWLLGWFQFVYSLLVSGKGNLFLTPPILRKQVAVSKEAKWKLLRLTIGSYADWATCHEIFIRREYALDRFSQGKSMLASFESNTASCETIIDLGANIGMASMFFHLTFPDANIIAVEPSRKNCRLIQENLFTISNLKVVQAAVGSEPGEVNLYDTGKGNNAFSTSAVTERVLERVPRITMAQLMQGLQGDGPLIVKVDIEGAESELFTGNFEWIGSASVIIVEIHDWLHPGEALSSSLLAAMASSNFDLVFFGENLFFFRN